jgi:integrase
MKECKERMSLFNLEMLIFDDGERYPVLVSEDGMPHFHVTLWVTSRLRPKGWAQSTITNKIYHVKKVLAWEESQQKDLFSQFRQGNFICLNEVEELTSFLSINISKQKTANCTQRNKIIQFGKVSIEQSSIPSNGNSHRHNTITSVTEYLMFLAKLATQFNSTIESNQKIEEMSRLLKSSRPKSKSDVGINRNLTVPEALIRDFMSIAHYENDKNPFKKEGVRFRNHLMFSILESLGIRRGEMLSLKLTNMILYGPEKSIMVSRSHDDKYDNRKKQPVAKTKERRLAISDSLAEEIDFYIKKYRSKVKGSRKHPYLFVTLKPGNTQGKPLSVSTFDNTIIPTMRSVDERFSAIYTHYFRHDWNERFSMLVDKKNDDAVNDKEQIGPGDEAKMRKHQMGHSLEQSGNTYNQRHIAKRANELSLIEQQELKNNSRDSSHNKK